MSDNENKYYLILDNIRSSENVGALFRTADAVGITKVFLTGVTPTPIDRFGREQTKIAKAALGAELDIPWEHVEKVEDAVARAKREGFTVFGLEQCEEAIDYKKCIPQGDTAFLVGREVDGLSEELINLCDHVCVIPMKGNKESLNVSVAAGILLYRALDR